MPDVAPLSSTFEELREGDAFTTHGRTVSEADVVSFAAQTGDFHPQHVDAAWAATGAFGERIAPAALTLSYALGLLRFDPDRVVALKRLADVVFTRPVKIGDTLSVAGRVAAVVPLDAETGSVTVSILVGNQRQQTVCRARAQILWRRHPPGKQSIEEVI